MVSKPFFKCHQTKEEKKIEIQSFHGLLWLIVVLVGYIYKSSYASKYSPNMDESIFGNF